MNVTKIAYVADCHLGNLKKWAGRTVGGVNTRAQGSLAALELAVQEALARGCVALGIAGDLFDYAHVEPQIVARTQSILDAIPTFAIVGNHDVSSMSVGDHALAPLQDHLTLVERPWVLPIGDVDVLCVPFEPGPVLEWFPQRLEQLWDDRRKGAGTHLMVHMGVSDHGAPYFLDGSVGAVKVDDLRDLMSMHAIDWCFAGDWHRHQVWDNGSRGIVQVGCLAPKRFPPNTHEHGHVGPLIVADGIDGVEMVDVPGPRFFKFQWCEDLVLPPVKAAPLYLKLLCKEDEEDAARAHLRKLKTDGLIREYELDVDRAQQRAAARTAAHEARQASSVVDALKIYVDTMPLGDHVDRTNVLQRARKYLA